MAPSTVALYTSLLSATGVQAFWAPRVFAAAPISCSSPELSCHNTTVQANLCCFNAPGGQLLQTQFWDTDPATGPVDSWTVHGLWPDLCDGTYEANCDSLREYVGIGDILKSAGQTDLLNYMNTYWKDYQGNDETFWEHEWAKHGTCVSTLEPSCYDNYTPHAEMIDYFSKTVELFKGLDSYKILSDAGILPSSSKTYTLAEIQAPLTRFHGFTPTIGCSGSSLNELWYHFNVRGSVVSGDFVAAAPDGSKSTCPSSGIKYIPKPGTPTSTGSTPSGTGGAFSGKGFLQAYTGGSNKGCLISAGTWYTSGTCATYTATTASGGFTLKTSKGSCGIVSNTFTCGSGVTATVFTASSGLLAYNGASNFYATAVPSGSTQAVVSVLTESVAITFKWQSS